VEAVYIKCRRLQYVFKKSRRVDELHALLKPFMLVQTLNDLDTQLPPLIVETITIGEFPKKQSTTFDLELSRLKCIADQRERDCALMALTMQTSKAKQPFIWTYIEHILETYHEKIIVFVYHKEMAAFLHDKLTEHKVDHISITGDTKPDSKRYELLDHFAKTESCRVGILSLGVCAVGFNLTFVNLVLVAELIFDSFAHKQSEGRCHRIGQTKTAVMQYLLMGPVDDILWNSLNTKLRVASHLLAA
jgi:SNF2 family DNA or RNA helicase